MNLFPKKITPKEFFLKKVPDANEYEKGIFDQTEKLQELHKRMSDIYKKMEKAIFYQLFKKRGIKLTIQEVDSIDWGK